MKKFLILIALVFLVFVTNSSASLTDEDKKELKSIYSLIKEKIKGPYTINYCTCVNGKKAPVADKKLRVRPDPCGQLLGVRQLFCSAYRTDLAYRLAHKYGLYVANIFSNEVFLWHTHSDHHRLAKGFILEKFFMEHHPESKLTTSRAYGGISGAEFEVKYAPLFFEKYYALPDCADFRHYLIQYELQRRFFIRGNISLISNTRNIATSIYRSYPPFKPIKDLVHNRMSAGLIPMIEEFQKNHPQDRKNAAKYERLISQLRKLTFVNKNDLKEYLPMISDSEIKSHIHTIVNSRDTLEASLLHKLSQLMIKSREKYAQRKISPKEAVELVNINVSANLIMHVTLSRLMELRKTWTVKELLNIQKDVIGGIYGAGLISHREYEAAVAIVNGILRRKGITLGEIHEELKRANRIVEWSQNSIKIAFWDVWEPWVYLFPDVQYISADIIRSSPLLGYASIIKSLQEHLLSRLHIEHYILDTELAIGIRAVNPGLAVGPLKFFSDKGEYTHNDILALETTNADLEPVAGIITKDEGNVVSHVQLLARSLGIPNAVFHDKYYRKLSSVKNRRIFYAISPMGRVIIKEADKMDEIERHVLADYEKNKKRKHDADPRGHVGKLTIDAERLDLARTDILPLTEVRRKDSGVICGPKAAYLGELKYHFPDNVARGLVIPFGVYNNHMTHARVVVPQEHKDKAIVQEGASLPDFVRRTYDTFFNSLLKSSHYSSTQLRQWIEPRLDIIRHSIENISLDPVFVSSLRHEIDNLRLFVDSGKENMYGVFIRSDTNVEDLPNFSGAGLNLTLFNIINFSDVLEGIKKVWASPFTYRSFSWRQSIISDPNLVFPSILVLESVPSDKSGVLITADVNTGDQSCMTIATAEGVGGTVDGSPAETLLCGDRDDKVILLAQFKAPQCRVLTNSAHGGVRTVASSGSEYVLTDSERHILVQAANKIKNTFPAEISVSGQPQAWDIEYGFVNGHLYLFQVRPFVGNEDMKNLPALTALDKGLKEKEAEKFSMEETIQWKE
jgi:phosphoenolpyruvate synthase/pyruvate phosphate dikinase